MGINQIFVQDLSAYTSGKINCCFELLLATAIVISRWPHSSDEEDPRQCILPRYQLNQI